MIGMHKNIKSTEQRINNMTQYLRNQTAKDRKTTPCLKVIL